MKNILVFFGGSSPEHEVSVITGLQILEHIDRTIYSPIPVYVSENSQFFKLDNIENRTDFSLKSKKEIFFGYDEKNKSPYFFLNNSKKQTIYSAVNTLHGGSGESGSMAGFFEVYNIPYTSSEVESSVICMNKSLTKDVVSKKAVPTIKSVTFPSFTIRTNIKGVCNEIQESFSFPLIIKPVHLGSSIGIKVVKAPIELELGLLEASWLDTEVMIEAYLENISEFNCSVRSHNGEILVSEIEKPLLKEEILSFSEKYEKGGKKVIGGMASLSRELPANLPEDVYKKIQNFSVKIFEACKCKGVVRIDFIQSSSGEVFFNEINPIPGSMAFYLWEVMGIPFQQQISDLIENSLYEQNIKNLVNHTHTTSIVKNFIKGFKY